MKNKAEMTYLREIGFDNAFIEASVIGTTVAVKRKKGVNKGKLSRK